MGAKTASNQRLAGESGMLRNVTHLRIGTLGPSVNHNDGVDSDGAQRSTTSLLGEVAIFINRTTIIVVLLAQGPAPG
jgi:hypothetical protein